MIRHFWNIISNKNKHEVLSEIEKMVNNFGFIIDYKKFSDNDFCIIAEIDNKKVEVFFNKLSENYKTEKYNTIFLNIPEDDELFLNIKIF